HGGATFELFARISEKNHAHSTLNPLAAYSKKMTLDEIMGDVMIAYPNTRPMCSANCDGAAAAVVVSGEKLKTLEPTQRRRPVNVSGGLESKGHPIAATGIANIWEVCHHLREEAGDRQIEGATVGLAHVIGLGSACGVHILERAAA